MSNVINFQHAKDRILENRVETDPFSMNDAFGDDEEAVMEFALLVAFDIVEALSDLNVSVENDPRSFKDILTIIEAVKGLIYRAKQEPYTWHKVSDHLGDFKDEELPDLLSEFLQKLVDSYD